jgi:capsular exopolysaccharide synthesis family protein
VTNEDEQELDLAQIIAVLRKRWWLVAALVAGAAITAFTVSSSAARRYESSAVVRVSNPNANRLFGNQQPNVDPKRLVETETKVLLANDVRLAVEAALGPRDARIDNVEVTNPTGTDLLDISVTSASPELARDAADTYASVYVANRRDESSKDLSTRAQELRGRSDQLSAQIAGLPAGDNRRGQMESSQNSFLSLANQYEAEAGLLNSNVRIIDRAQLPVAPVSPRPMRDAAALMVIALVLGLGLVFVLDHLDDRVTGADDLERAVPDLPVLASVPLADQAGRWGAKRLAQHRRSLVARTSTDAEVYRTLRTNVRFANLEDTRRLIMITSASGSEGKSTVACNLAVALAESGQRVILVSADLRRPSLGDFFGLDETRRGLTTVLVGDAEMGDCLEPVTLERGHRLYVMPTGPLPPNPAELLESPRMEGLVRELAEADVDLVLIDCPPVLPVADSLAIGQLADGVIMIAAAGQTRISHLRDALRRLERVRASVIGVVLNGVVVRSHQYQYYGVRTAPDGPAPGADGSGLGPRTPAGPSTGLEALPPPPPPVAVR